MQCPWPEESDLHDQSRSDLIVIPIFPMAMVRRGRDQKISTVLQDVRQLGTGTARDEKSTLREKPNAKTYLEVYPIPLCRSRHHKARMEALALFALLVVQLPQPRRVVPFRSPVMTGVLHASLCGRCVFLFLGRFALWLAGLAGLAGSDGYPTPSGWLARRATRSHLPGCWTMEEKKGRLSVTSDLRTWSLLFCLFRSWCSCSFDAGAPAKGATRQDRRNRPPSHSSGTGPRWVIRGGRTENAGREARKAGVDWVERNGRWRVLGATYSG
jgi:hypothetical protein